MTLRLIQQKVVFCRENAEDSTELEMELLVVLVREQYSSKVIQKSTFNLEFLTYEEFVTDLLILHLQQASKAKSMAHCTQATDE